MALVRVRYSGWGPAAGVCACDDVGDGRPPGFLRPQAIACPAEMRFLSKRSRAGRTQPGPGAKRPKPGWSRPVATPMSTPCPPHSGRPTAAGPAAAATEPAGAARAACSCIALVAVPDSDRDLLLTTIAGPSNSSFTIRSFEWLRDHGAAKIASQIESIYYTLNAPSTGGPALHATALRISRAVAADAPARHRPADSPGAARRGRVGADRDLERRQLPGPDHPVPQRPQLPADGGRGGLDRHAPHLDRALPGPAGALGQPAARPDGGPAGAALAAAGHLQQRLQAPGLPRRLRRSAGSPTPRCTPGWRTIVGYANGRVDIPDWTGGPRGPGRGATSPARTCP